MSKLNIDGLKEAISTVIAKSEEKKRKFQETVELQIGLKDYDTQRYYSCLFFMIDFDLKVSRE